MDGAASGSGVPVPGGKGGRVVHPSPPGPLFGCGGGGHGG